MGGKQIGAQTAEFLAAQGKDVTIIEQSRGVGRDITIWDVFHFRHRLSQAGVKVLSKSSLKVINPTELVVVSHDGEEDILSVDTVVVAMNMRPNKEFWEALQGKIDELYAVGYCVAPRKALNAIHEGFRVGAQI